MASSLLITEVKQFWASTILLASLSVDSKKLCCQDRMGIGVRKSLVVVCPWMLRTSWQGDSPILLWRCPNQTNRQKRLKLGIYEQTVWVRNNMWRGARMPVIIASASTEAACQATMAFGCKGPTSPPPILTLTTPTAGRRISWSARPLFSKKIIEVVCMFVCLFILPNWGKWSITSVNLQHGFFCSIVQEKIFS